MTPKHINNVPEHRKARAPYNFVELPDTPVLAETMPDGKLPSHDRYHHGRLTGTIDCTLMTASLLYTRCGFAPDDYAAFGETPSDKLTDEQRMKRAPFFSNPLSLYPVIPGSSLRGMLRTLVEIIGHGKIEQVTDNELYYRALGDSAVATYYTSHFTEHLGDVEHDPRPLAPCYRSRVHTGFFRLKDGRYVITECAHARIEDNHGRIKDTDNEGNVMGQSILPPRMGEGESLRLYIGAGGAERTRIPNPRYQYANIWVDLEPTDSDHFFPAQPRRHDDMYLRYREVRAASWTRFDNAVKGMLVLTGPMVTKHLDFVFLPQENDVEHEVPDDMVRRIESDDQITNWQETAFPRQEGVRAKGGGLRDGEPVFFLLDDDTETGQRTVRFLGRAQLFRLPYARSPRAFVPETLRAPDVVDIAEAMFGFVRGQKQTTDQARKGRVSVSDAICKQTVDVAGEPAMWPQILSGPKPTTFQHYLVQQNADRKQLKHYSSEPGTETVIRGYKLYWHREGPQGQVPREQIAATDEQVRVAPTQYPTKIMPVKTDTPFDFMIRFENLSKVELGALLWVLDIGSKRQYRLSLGLGKPLGMGAISIQRYSVRIDDRTHRDGRYGKLFAADQSAWHTAESEVDAAQLASYRADFENHILRILGATTNGQQQWRRRVQSLRALLSWPGPDLKETRYMRAVVPQGEQSEYRDRPVLPSPLQIAPGQREPRGERVLPQGGPDAGTQNTIDAPQPAPPQPAPPQPPSNNGAARRAKVAALKEKVAAIKVEVTALKETIAALPVDQASQQLGQYAAKWRLVQKVADDAARTEAGDEAHAQSVELAVAITKRVSTVVKRTGDQKLRHRPWAIELREFLDRSRYKG